MAANTTLDGDWPYRALLWWHVWSMNATYLHIPKTGGSVIEQADRRSSIWHLRMLPQSTLHALCHRLAESGAILPQRSGARSSPVLPFDWSW